MKRDEKVVQTRVYERTRERVRKYRAAQRPKPDSVGLTDMLVNLADLLGGYVSGVRVTVRLPGKVGGYAKIIGAISAQGWGMYATGSVLAPKREGYWDIVLKVRDVSAKDVISVLEQVEACEIVDLRES